MSENQQSKETIEVDAAALHHLLSAVLGPDHYIRELVVTLGFADKGLSESPHPIKILRDQYNEWLSQKQALALAAQATVSDSI